jgi:hypothetical protein
VQYRTWVKQKCELAHALGKGALGGSYAEGAIILCATISAMSSLLWRPSNGTDAYRFAEIVTRFPPDGLDPTRVSAPLLAEKFPELRQTLGISTKSFYLAEDTDKSEAEVLKICSAAGLPDCKETIRRYSYASLLYKQVRCGFVHVYQAGKNATDSDALREIAGVGTCSISYVNQMPDTGGADARRIVYYPLEWISAAAQAAASGMDRECTRKNKPIFENLGLAIPHSWWSKSARGSNNHASGPAGDRRARLQKIWKILRAGYPIMWWE